MKYFSENILPILYIFFFLLSKPEVVNLESTPISEKWIHDLLIQSGGSPNILR